MVGQVKDTGIGIAKEDLSQLFSKFGKLQRTAEINQEGIGLGLTITKQIVESAEGYLTVDSAGVGHGSVFSFSMRMCKEQDFSNDAIWKQSQD